MTRLRVLITNITLATRTGTETYIRDLACNLVRRGHHPVVYSPELGDIAREIEAATVPVVNDLRNIAAPPDIIHGHHHAETLTALLHFPGVPAIGFCHDWTSFWDTPVRHPRVRRYVAVDETCRDRLIARHGIPEAQVRVIMNAVDLAQFPPRGPLPAKPQRALVFSNLAGEENYLGMVRAACETAGITLDVIGQNVGKPCARPGEVLGQYDIVFAKARCALEAMAVGTAVILCDVGGAGGLVTTGNFEQLRRKNFGRRALCEPVSPDILLRGLAAYQAADAEAVSRRVREQASLETTVDELLDLYREVLTEQDKAVPIDLEMEGRAAADSLRWLTPYIQEIHSYRSGRETAERERSELQVRTQELQQQHGDLQNKCQLAATQNNELQIKCNDLQMRCDELQQQRDMIQTAHNETQCQLAAMRAERDALQTANSQALSELASAQADGARLQQDLADVHRSMTLRMARRLRGLPLMSRLVRLAARGRAD